MLETELDRTDWRILAELQRDGRLTNQELAERVALSPSPCLRRVRRLEERGVIRQYVAVVDAEKVGLGLLAYVSVRLQKHVDGGHAPIDQFARDVQSWPEVVACYAMTGDMDYLMRVQVRDLAHFSKFALDTLMKHPSVVDMRSSFALSTIKESIPGVELPLAPAR
ncbi:Lrp/AsnC family transcriptional regulator [Pigmentiphaga sp.]|jgi:Transcriptional regulators|uniref:Lrp/AsnC family transcriptional regulator n=1 Tax=Pigmentiphaga sp. TaxID=1977564 RepID=UPI0025ECCDCF|nr:Lrp/AsnC family transcriptional regulator [Pigmentiphaga sp.]MBX6320181.1 Lrp/AsnC family transcriptional regulator [Pigmentiphaga sp.]